MSSCSQAPFSLAITSREGHEGVPLLFDVHARGIEAFNSIVRGDRVACDAYRNGPNAVIYR